MDETKADILAEVADYYSRKISAHGASPLGVDWNGPDGQVTRFRELARLFDLSRSFSVNDLGCGYGAFHDYLREQGASFTYLGADISPDMIAAARDRIGHFETVKLAESAAPVAVADYTVASGIFNVRMERSEQEWQSYVEAVLDNMDRFSTIGFAFNCLTSYSDPDRMRSDLHYANPLYLFDLCKRRYARDVALLHNYGLFEFTILVRKAA